MTSWTKFPPSSCISCQHAPVVFDTISDPRRQRLLGRRNADRFQASIGVKSCILTFRFSSVPPRVGGLGSRAVLQSLAKRVGTRSPLSRFLQLGQSSCLIRIRRVGIFFHYLPTKFHSVRLVVLRVAIIDATAAARAPTSFSTCRLLRDRGASPG